MPKNAWLHMMPRIMKPPVYTHTQHSEAGNYLMPALTDPLSAEPIRSCLHVPHLRSALHKLEGNPAKSLRAHPPS